MKTEKISIKELKILFNIEQAKKEGLVFAKKTDLYLCSIKGVNIGFFGFIWHRNKVVVKNIYIVPEHRGKGNFCDIMNWVNKITYGLECEATCTKMSLNGFLRNGFLVVKEYKNGCKKVKRENIF
jgi:hypothetical protein